jgi:DNA-directed RNA polymerase subunit E'/Rpb7
MESGIVVQAVTIKVVTAQSIKNPYTYIKFRQMPFYPSEEAIVRVLTQSLVTSGIVKNISIFKMWFPTPHTSTTLVKVMSYWTPTLPAYL